MKFINMKASSIIGLMNVSDYGYAVSPNYWTSQLSSYNTNSIITNNWMYMGFDEWTISSFQMEEAHLISFTGSLIYDYTGQGASGVRPTFYLKSITKYTGTGDGSKTNPYRLSI